MWTWANESKKDSCETLTGRYEKTTTERSLVNLDNYKDNVIIICRSDLNKKRIMLKNIMIEECCKKCANIPRAEKSKCQKECECGRKIQ